MMQQIAPLQTDIAAPQGNDIGLNTDTIWTGTGDANQSSNGQQFGAMLGREQDRLNTKRNDGYEQTKQPESKPVTDSNAANRSENSAKEPNRAESNTTAKSNTAEKSDEKPINDSAENETQQVSKVESKPTTEDAKSVKPDVDENEQDVIQPIVDADSKAAQQDYYGHQSEQQNSLLDLVEQIQAINETEQTPVVTQPIWDGEVTEMVVVDKPKANIEHGVLRPIDPDIEVLLPVDPVVESEQGTGDVELVEQIVAAVEQQKSDKDTPNDLFVDKPIKLDMSVPEDVLTDSEQALVKSLLDTDEREQDVLVEQTEELEPVVPIGDPEAPKSVQSDVVTETPVITDTPVVPVKLSLDDAQRLASLANMEPSQQELAITAIAERTLSANAEPVAVEQQKAFVAALQSGVAEYKEQLKQGREPGFSLKSLVNDALAVAEIPVSPEVQTQVSQAVDQSLLLMAATDAVRQLRQDSQAISAQVQRTEGLVAESVAQADANKASQSQPLLDKPANILKPEGQTQFAEKIRWIVNARNSFAEIRLDPPELGSVQVKVNMSGEAATVNFVVQSSQARDALDQALPRLRDMLNQQGIELGQSSVQQEQQQQNGEQQQGQFAEGKADDGMDEIAGEVIEQRVVNGSAGGIDFYA